MNASVRVFIALVLLSVLTTEHLVAARSRVVTMHKARALLTSQRVIKNLMESMEAVHRTQQKETVMMFQQNLAAFAESMKSEMLAAGVDPDSTDSFRFVSQRLTQRRVRVGAIGDEIVDKAKEVGGKIVDGAKAVGGKIADGAKALGDKIVEVYNDAKDLAKKGIDAVKAKIEQADVLGKLKGFFDTLKTIGEDIADLNWKLVVPILKGFVNGFTLGVIDTIQEKLEECPEGGFEKVKTAWGQVKTALSNLASITGITKSENWKALFTALGNLFGALWNLCPPLMKFLGIWLLLALGFTVLILVVTATGYGAILTLAMTIIGLAFTAKFIVTQIGKLVSKAKEYGANKADKAKRQPILIECVKLVFDIIGALVAGCMAASGLKEDFSKASDAVSSQSGGLKGFIDGLGKGFSGLKDALPKLGELLKSGNPTEIMEFAKTAVEVGRISHDIYQVAAGAGHKKEEGSKEGAKEGGAKETHKK